MPERIPTPLDKMRSAIQLAGFHYIVCLKALPTNADHEITFDKMTYAFEAIGRVGSNALHGEFQRWAAVSVLRDLIENFSTFLMEIYGSAMQANPGAAYSATLIQFERKGIEDQLDILSKDFSIDAAWTTRLVGYNRARNCLAHRQGKVGPRDANDGNELVVRWLATKIELAIIRGQHVHGQAARVEVQDKEKRIGVGSFLIFLPTDILEICQTFQFAAAAFGTLASQR